MSLTLDKLRALRRQAGAVDVAPVPAHMPVPLPAPEPSAGGQWPSAACIPCPAADHGVPPTPAADPMDTAAAGAVLAGSVLPLATPTTARASTLPPGKVHPVTSTAITTADARPGTTTPPPSSLDWINHAIRHADPAALMARAHGKPATLRPATRHTPSTTRPLSTPPQRLATSTETPAPDKTPANITPNAGARVGGAPPTVPPQRTTTRAPSALDWIQGAIRHADPAELAQRAAASMSERTCTASARSTATTPAIADLTLPAHMPPAPPTQSRATQQTPRSVGDLQRLLATRQRAQAATATSTPAETFRRDLPGEEIAPGLWLSQDHVPMSLPDGPLPLDFAKRPDERVDPRDLLFFDTETTGLAGGTGTRAFMIGAADFHEHPQQGPGLRVRQLLISTLGAETAMLDAFAHWLTPATVLSSFNGRSYDAPLLKTRYRLARRREPLSALDHIDLLHPARRAWKGLWENCRLGTIEKQVLGIEREDDVPGSQAPAAWLDFLRGGSSARIHRVAAHNHQDVVTLALLMQQLAAQDAAVQPCSSD